MERDQQITSALIVAYWQCPRKAFCLLDESQQVVPHELESIVAEHRRRDRHQYLKRLKDKFGDVPSYTHGVLGSGQPVLSDAELEYQDLLASADVLLKVEDRKRRRKTTYTPVLVGGTHSVTQERGLR